MVRVSNVVVGLLLLAVGVALGQSRQGPAQTVTVYDTLALAQYAQKLADARIETEGLRARLEGVQRRPPRVIYRTDTVVTPPDTVFEFISVRDGRLTASVLIQTDTLYAPELHTNSDISDCDDGFEVSAAGVVCDPARLGHLWIGPWLDSADPMLAAWWKPSFRSAWEGYIGHGSRLHVGLRYGVRLF